MAEKNEKARRPLSLFLYFLKIGWFTFGGGWSIIAQIQHDYVEKKALLTEEELLDLTSVGRSVPGVMITNVSFLFGYKLSGIAGAFAAIAGMLIPPVFILSVVTLCYLTFRENVYVARALIGVRAAVAPIIASSIVKLTKGALKDAACYIIALVALLLCMFTNLSLVIVVVAGAFAGLAIHGLSRVWRRKHGGA